MYLVDCLTGGGEPDGNGGKTYTTKFEIWFKEKQEKTILTGKKCFDLMNKYDTVDRGRAGRERGHEAAVLLD